MKKLAATIFLAILFVFLIGIKSDFYEHSSHFLYAEFLQSSDFGQLVQDNIHTFNYRVNMGTYNLGFPISPQNETVYGTNRGVRMIPLLVFLNLIQKGLTGYWDKIYFLFIVTLPFVMFLFATFLFEKKRDLPTIVAATFYACNPWIIHRLNTGFWQLHIAYAFLPILAYFFLTLGRQYSRRKMVLIVLMTYIGSSLSYFFQPHFLVGLTLCIPLWIAYSLREDKYEWKSALSRLFFVGALFIFSIAFHLVPSLIYPPYLYTHTDIFSLPSLAFNGQGSTLLDVLNLTSRSPFEVDIVGASHNSYLIGYMALIMVTLMLLRKYNKSKKRKDYFFGMGLLLIIFVFLSKGLNSPLKDLSRWVYLNLSPLHVFRDPSRLASMIVLIGTLLIQDLTEISHKRMRLFAMVCLLYIFMTLPSQILTLNRAIDFQKLPQRLQKLEHIEKLNSGLVMLDPDFVSLDKYHWFKGISTSTYTSPIEALVPLNVPQAHYSGSNDTHQMQTLLFAQSVGREDIFSRLMITRRITNLQSGSPSVTDISKNTSLFMTANEPLFVLGDRRIFSEVSQSIPTYIPIIMLHNYINAKEFISTGGRSFRVYVPTNQEEAPRDAFLFSLSDYSINPSRLLFDPDKYYYYLPYAGDFIKKGFVFPSGKAISLRDSDVICPKLSKSDVGSILAVSMIDPNRGLIWKTNRIEELSQGSNCLTSNSYSSVIDDVLIIPEKIYNKSKTEFERKLHSSEIIQDLDILKKEPATRIEFKQKSYAEYSIRTASPWLTMRFPYDTNWTYDKAMNVFITDGYGMSFFNRGKGSIKILRYKPEALFRTLLWLSIGTFLSSSILIVVCLFTICYEYIRNALKG